MGVGYPDFERTQAWDGPTLVQQIGLLVPNGSPYNFGPFDVSHWAAVQGTIGISGGDAELVLTWANLKSGGLLTGERVINIFFALSQQAGFNILNLGPWLSGSVTPIGGVSSSLTAVIQGTNRVHTLDFIPPRSVLVEANNFSSSAIEYFYPYCLYSGPIDVWFHSPGNVQNVYLQVLLANDTWETVDQRLVATGENTWTMIAPDSAWRLAVYNPTSTVNGCYLVAAASTTGST